MKTALLSLTLLLTASGCPAPTPQKPAAHATEDTSDETVIQFHPYGQLQYGKWYGALDGNTACRWTVEGKPAGSDSKPKVLASGGNEDGLRVPAELPGKDVYLRFNKACGTFQEVPR